MGTTTSVDYLVKITAPPVSNLGYRNSFTTQFGNQLQGMFITWSNDASSDTGDATTATMNVQVNFHWYNTELDSTNPTVTKYMSWDIIVLNPDPATYVGALKDSWNGWLQFDTTTGTPDKLQVR